MTRESFQEALLGMTHLASASGLSSQDQAFALMLTAVTLADKEIPGGMTREQCTRMATFVFDKLRKSLHSGAQAG